MTYNQFQKITLNRFLFLWGCGHLGTNLNASFRLKNINVEGFIDRRTDIKEFCGKKVYRHQELEQPGKDKIFIIITAMLHENEIKEQCRKAGLQEGKDFIGISQLKPFHIDVDVAGSCNLLCPSCPRGNVEAKYNDGMMSVETYEKVLNKLIKEVSFLSDIQLYSRGEPLLNLNLPEIIRMTVEKGISVAISSNLSFRHSIIDVVKAQPDWFRISLSGYKDSYSIMHEAGKWNLVEEQMRNLSKYRHEYAPNMQVEVNYHMYKHNLEDIEPVSQLSQELGFVFQPNFAFIDPLEALIEYRNGQELSPKLQEAASLLLIDIDEAMELAENRNESYCPCEKTISISANLRVMNCPHLFDPNINTLASNFLDIPMTEIKKRLDDRSICRECKSNSLNSFYSIYNENSEVKDK